MFLLPIGDHYVISVYYVFILYIRWRSLLTLSFPRVINIKFLLQPHQKYYITQYEELGFP